MICNTKVFGGTDNFKWGTVKCNTDTRRISGTGDLH